MKKVKPGCDLVGLKSKIASIYESMKGDDVFKENLGDVGTAFRKIYENETGVKLEDSDFFPPSNAKLHAVENRVKNIKNLILKDGGFATSLISNFYNTSALGKQAPEIADITEKFIHINYEMKGRQYEHGNIYRTILKKLMREGKERGYKVGFYKNFKKKADDLEKKTLTALARLKDTPQDYERSQREWQEAFNEERDFYLKHEGELFEEMVGHIEKNVPAVADAFIKANPDASEKEITSHILSSISNFETLNYKNEIVPISSNMVDAVKLHLELMNKLYDTQVKGVKAFVDGLKINLRDTTNQAKIDEIANTLMERILPEYRRGYYPHIIIDASAKFMDGLMPHLERVNQAASLKLTGHEEKTLGNSLQELDAYLTGHEATRTDNNFDYSRNYLTVTKNYMDEINRFNYIAHSNLVTKESIASVSKVWSQGDGALNGFAQNMHDFIRELHAAQTGQNVIENPQVNAALRFMLGAEFVSKLGWNMRSGVRNATQSLLNWVHFGFTANSQADAYIRENNLEGDIDDLLRGKGLLFLELVPELQESGAMARGAHRMIEVTSEGNVRFAEPSKLEVAAESLAAFTQHGLGKHLSAGSFMQKVENYNRKRTFQTAYAIFHQKLSENLLWRQDMVQKGFSEDRIQSSIVKKSEKFATNMVTMLHFDYSDVSKARFLRHPAGRVIGQFQHFGFKLFEYNMGLLKGLKDDAVTGDIRGEEAMRAYRMAIVYFLGPMAAESITGVSFSNLIENDTASRLSQLATVLTGTDEEIRKATYDRGITALVGGPFISDALRFGNLLGVINLDDNSRYRFLTGYEQSAFEDGHFESYEMYRTLSSGLTRTIGTTLPIALNGHIGRAFQMEFGIYPTKEARSKKKALIEGIKGTTDNKAVMQALDYLQGFPKEKKKKKPADRPDIYPI